MADEAMFPNVTDQPKKRKINGHSRDIAKKARLSSHETGPACLCSRLRCFEVTTAEERKRLIDHFNSLPNKDLQDNILASFIEVNSVKQRRPRGDEEDAKLHDNSYKYVVKVPRGEKASNVQVCIKAFLSIFGIKKGRVERIRSSLSITGLPPTDQRGKHGTRPFAFTDEKMNTIIQHIRSFRGRHSHYSLKESRKLYLPEDLNVKKMHRLFMELHPDEKCSYESYRKVFMEKFNIGFGYPRKDTCSTCDELNVKLQSPALTPEDRATTLQDRELHLRKAAVFYDRKSKARQTAQQSVSHAAVAFDFQKNLNCPNVPTNDVYYRRQLALYTFDVHVLESDEVYLYCYDETTARKGADDVCSMLMDFFEHICHDKSHPLNCFVTRAQGRTRTGRSCASFITW